MKKRISSMILAACMTLALGACGSFSTDEVKTGTEIMTVTLDGKEYDLTDDMQQVVGKMVKNGLNAHQIVYPNTAYDENGKIYSISIIDFPDTNLLYADEFPLCMSIENSPIVVDVYEFGSFHKGSVTFKTADNITQKSDDNDLKKLEDFVPMYPAMGSGDNCAVYIALYADGENVDLQMYGDAYDAFVKEAECTDISSALESRLDKKYFFRGGLLFLDSSDWYDGNMSIEDFEKNHSHFRENIMLYSAAQEKFEALETGKIGSVDIVRYNYKTDEKDSPMMWVDYYHYYADENWDRNKFY